MTTIDRTVTSTTGSAVLDLAPRLRRVRVEDPAGLARLSVVSRIAVIGASGTGKTTMVRGARTLPDIFPLALDVPLRFTTRRPRQGDDSEETQTIDSATFARHVQVGAIGLSWARAMSDGTHERYGFATSQGRLAVLSGNNSLYECPDTVKPADTLQHNTLWIAVYAPQAVRERRLRQRSPDLFINRPDEAARRLADLPEVARKHAHLSLWNDDECADLAVSEFQLLVALCAVLSFHPDGGNAHD